LEFHLTPGLKQSHDTRVFSSERSQTPGELVERENEYRSLFEGSPIGLAHVGLDGRWFRVNQRLVEILGYPADELIGMPFATLTHPDDLAESIGATSALLSGALQVDEVEKRYRRSDGTYVSVCVRVRLHRDAAGTPKYFITAVEDISARKAAEYERSRIDTQLQAVIKNLPVALWVLDPTGVITLSEGRLLERIGVRPGDLVGQSQLELYRDVPAVTALTRRALAGEHMHETIDVFGVVFEMWYSPLHDELGRLTGVLGITTDISERVRLEEQYRQAQKMEAVGQLAGGVAHDFNNLLTAMLGYAELALAQLPPEDPVAHDIEEIRKAGVSAAALTHQLLAFSRRQILQPRVLDLNATVRHMMGLLRRVIGEDIQLETRLCPSLLPVSADWGQIEQVIMNLAVNARDAMPEGGQLILETGVAELVNQDAGESGAPVAHSFLAVSDTGTGIDPETRVRLFEPFFSTKERGKGTGLGLSTVYGIVKQSRGLTTVDSEVGIGTTIKIFLPALPRDTVVTPIQEVQTECTGGTETVLLVEDQEEVRHVARDILVHYGYTVVEAATGREALETALHYKGPLDLLITDVVMPAMNGRQVSELLTVQRPSLRVLFTSGYTDDAVVLRDVLTADAEFLQKPFSAPELLMKVRHVLNKAPRPGRPKAPRDT
jgi:two-component system cell cycle sensor histidine kinase/response regulator CckA